MVQAAQPRHRHHATVSDTDGSLSLAGSFLLRSQMSPVLVVVAHVLGKEEPFYVTLIECDHMVEQIMPAASNPTLGHSILPRTCVHI